VTFGSFNNNAKINARVLDLWARAMRSVPESRLLLKFEGGNDPEVRNRYLRELAGRGVEGHRVQIVGRQPVLEHFSLYNRIDLALDTFPYHGTTTTCEALWMGVPTLTRIGTHHASRVGLSLLTRVGLEVFAADSDGQYVAKAAAFAGQLDQLAEIRRSLRKMMLASPLCNARDHARDVESAFRRMWRQWCGNQKTEHRRQKSEDRS
jgi:predicted O-linked N-acetylglucosamine transferase (SPINDLY family)